MFAGISTQEKKVHDDKTQIGLAGMISMRSTLMDIVNVPAWNNNLKGFTSTKFFTYIGGEDDVYIEPLTSKWFLRVQEWTYPLTQYVAAGVTHGGDAPEEFDLCAKWIVDTLITSRKQGEGEAKTLALRK